MKGYEQIYNRIKTQKVKYYMGTFSINPTDIILYFSIRILYNKFEIQLNKIA